MVFSPRFTGLARWAIQQSREALDEARARWCVSGLHFRRSMREGYWKLGRGGGIGDQVRLEQAQAVIAGCNGRGQFNSVVHEAIATTAAELILGRAQVLFPDLASIAGGDKLDSRRQPNHRGVSSSLESQAGRLAIDEDRLAGLELGLFQRLKGPETKHFTAQPQPADAQRNSLFQGSESRLEIGGSRGILVRWRPEGISDRCDHVFQE